MNTVIKKNPTVIILFIGLLLGLLLLFYWILHSTPQPKVSLSHQLVDNNVGLISGLNFDSGEPALFNPLTEKETIPCQKATADYPIGKNNYRQQKCKVNESDINAPAGVIDAIKNSREILRGTIKQKPARFAVSVTALFEGSMCTTIWIVGNQTENCTSLAERCNNYVPNSPRIDRVEGLRKACNELSELKSANWPSGYIPLS